MKYELVALSMNFRNKIYRKEKKEVIVSTQETEKELDAAYAAGYIKPVGTKANNPNEVIEQYEKNAEAQKAKAAKKLEAERKKQVIDAVKNKIDGLKKDLEVNKAALKGLETKEADAKKAIEGLEGEKKAEAEKVYKAAQEETNKAKAAGLNISKEIKKLEDSISKTE